MFKTFLCFWANNMASLIIVFSWTQDGCLSYATASSKPLTVERSQPHSTSKFFWWGLPKKIPSS